MSHKDYNVLMEAELKESSDYVVMLNEDTNRYAIFQRSYESQCLLRYRNENGDTPAFDTREEAIKYIKKIDNKKS